MIDKFAHAVIGFIIYVAIGFPAVVLAAIGKELWDNYRHGRPDVWDAVATLLMPLILEIW